MQENIDSRRIHPKADEWMVAQGLRKPKVEKYSFEKTKEEREKLKLVRNNYSFKSSSFKPAIEVTKRLTIHVVNKSTEHRNVFKTTYSALLKQSDISTYLNSNNIDKKNIVKSYYGGKHITL